MTIRPRLGPGPVRPDSAVTVIRMAHGLCARTACHGHGASAVSLCPGGGPDSPRSHWRISKLKRVMINSELPDHIITGPFKFSVMNRVTSFCAQM